MIALRKPDTDVEKEKDSEKVGWLTFDPLKPIVNEPSAEVSGPVVATAAFAAGAKASAVAAAVKAIQVRIIKLPADEYARRSPFRPSSISRVNKP